MKKLKDYLHLYLGCPVKGKQGIMVYTLVSIDVKGNCLFNDGYGNQMWLPEDEYKPILRPLSDMTEQEAIEVFKIVSLFDLSECVFDFHNDETECWINAGINGKVVDAIKFVGDNIEAMNNDGSFSPINPISEVTAYYLSKHFDLFKLIPRKLAIDKTSL